MMAWIRHKSSIFVPYFERIEDNNGCIEFNSEDSKITIVLTPMAIQDLFSYAVRFNYISPGQIVELIKSNQLKG